MDLLSPLFSRFTLSARVSYTGALCGIASFDNDQGIGVLHVLRRGRLRVVQPPAASFELTEPTLLFGRQPFAHRFEVDDAGGADLVCGFIDFGSTLRNPLLRAMPDFLRVLLSAIAIAIAGVQSTLDLLFGEAFAQRPGRAAGIDRLVEFFVVLLLRHCIDSHLLQVGVLAALADPRLAKALTAMHDRPEKTWRAPPACRVPASPLCSSLRWACRHWTT